MASALIGADQMMKAAAAAAAAAGQHHLVTHPYHHHHHHAAHHGTYHHPHLIHYQSSTNEFIAQQSHYIQDIVSAPSAAESSAPAPTRSVSPESPTNPEDDEVEDEEKVYIYINSSLEGISPFFEQQVVTARGEATFYSLFLFLHTHKIFRAARLPFLVSTCSSLKKNSNLSL